MPRHPPCALKHLFTTRCSHPLCNTQHTTTPQPTTTTTTPTNKGCVRQSRPGARRNTPNKVSPQDPTVCQATMNQLNVPPSATPETSERDFLEEGEPKPHKTSRPGQPHQHGGLLRKEVIQPHLPVRLPCYDFVPIAGPTFDDSLPQGVRPSASGVTNFHDVTGGVYKARERIHRSVADLRLLATPTSRGRVADPDPN
jgi:hypothetical protein